MSDNFDERATIERPIQRVAIIGAGKRGKAFARRCVQAGCDVVLEDVLSSKLRHAEEEMHKLTGVGGNAAGHLRFAGSVEDAVREADVAVDFVPDELESKLEIVSLIDRMAPPRTIFCTPTSLSITDLASCSYRAGLCVALGDLPEDDVQGSVNLIRGDATTDETVARVAEWMSRLGIEARIVADACSPALVRKM